MILPTRYQALREKFDQVNTVRVASPSKLDGAPHELQEHEDWRRKLDLANARIKKLQAENEYVCPCPFHIEYIQPFAQSSSRCHQYHSPCDTFPPAAHTAFADIHNTGANAATCTTAPTLHRAGATSSHERAPFEWEVQRKGARSKSYHSVPGCYKRYLKNDPTSC